MTYHVVWVADMSCSDVGGLRGFISFRCSTREQPLNFRDWPQFMYILNQLKNTVNLKL